MKSIPKVVEKVIAHKGKFRSFYNYKYISKGAVGNWEVIKSETNDEFESAFGGIKAAPIIFQSTKLGIIEPHIILIASYRIPVENYIIEFPSGMANPKETVEQCVEREVLEETGYHVKRILYEYNPSNLITYTDPWKSDDNEVLHIVEVDADDEINSIHKQNLDDCECIEPIMVKLKNLKQELEIIMEKNKWLIDSQLWGFALGMSFPNI